VGLFAGRREAPLQIEDLRAARERAPSFRP